LFKYFSDGDLSFEIEKCGATLTWEYFFPDAPVPAFLKYVQDRDLWTWQEPKSKVINEAFSHIKTGLTQKQVLSEFDRLAAMSQDDLIYHFETLGEMLLAPKLSMSRELAKKAQWVKAWGYKFLACPLEPTEAYYYNDVMEVLYSENHDSPFVCTYIKKEDGYKLSFRSRQQYDGFDCAKLARSIGGGGHREASGAELPNLPWQQN
jgi:oligoribonuclease NrnB/cAMP/cGMP phosphodiesterase (DHH superfamily)